MHGGHALSVRIERHFGFTRKQRQQSVFAKSQTGRRDRQRTFGGIADSAKPLLLAIQFEFGVVAQASSRQQQGQRRVVSDLLSENADFFRNFGSSRRLALLQCLGQVDPITRHVEHGDGHAVFRQRAGLVRTDHRHRAERFDGGKFANQCVMFEHSPRTNGQRDGRDGR